MRVGAFREGFDYSVAPAPTATRRLNGYEIHPLGGSTCVVGRRERRGMHHVESRRAPARELWNTHRERRVEWGSTAGAAPGSGASTGSTSPICEGPTRYVDSTGKLPEQPQTATAPVPTAELVRVRATRRRFATTTRARCERLASTSPPTPVTAAGAGSSARCRRLFVAAACVARSPPHWSRVPPAASRCVSSADLRQDLLGRYGSRHAYRALRLAEVQSRRLSRTRTNQPRFRRPAGR